MSWMVILCLVICFIPVSTTVIETTQNYYCRTELHQVESEYGVANADCDQYWVAQESSIGTFLKSTPECVSPCHEVSAGRISLTNCINITLHVICSGDSLMEHRVHFYGERTPRSQINPVMRERIGIVLSMAVLLIIIFVCCIGAKSHGRNAQGFSEGFIINDSLKLSKALSPV